MNEFRVMDNLVSGINDEEMKKTILEIYRISEEMKKKFLEIENIMGDIESVYTSDGAQEIFSKFKNFKNNFAVVAANTEIYGSDLTKVRNNFHKMIDNAASVLK